jgi:hypothetical protein
MNREEHLINSLIFWKMRGKLKLKMLLVRALAILEIHCQELIVILFLDKLNSFNQLIQTFPKHKKLQLIILVLD